MLGETKVEMLVTPETSLGTCSVVSVSKIRTGHGHVVQRDPWEGPPVYGFQRIIPLGDSVEVVEEQAPRRSALGTGKAFSSDPTTLPITGHNTWGVT